MPLDKSFQNTLTSSSTVLTRGSLKRKKVFTSVVWLSLHRFALNESISTSTRSHYSWSVQLDWLTTCAKCWPSLTRRNFSSSSMLLSFLLLLKFAWIKATCCPKRRWWSRSSLRSALLHHTTMRKCKSWPFFQLRKIYGLGTPSLGLSSQFNWLSRP